MAAIDRAANHEINLMLPPARIDLLGLGGRDLQPPMFLKDLGDQITGKVFEAAAEAVREPAHLLCEIRQGKLRPLLSVGKLSLRLRKLFNAKLGPLLSVGKLHKMPIRPPLSVGKLSLRLRNLFNAKRCSLLSVGKLSLRLQKIGRDVAQIGHEVAQIGHDASQFVEVSLGHEIIVGLDHHMGKHIRLLLGKDLKESRTNLGDRGHRNTLFVT